MGKEIWNIERIRQEIKGLDVKTGLNGSALPITFGDSKRTLGQFSTISGGSFRFSRYYFDNPNWPVEEAIDVIRHEYAHYMEHVLYGRGGHGLTWKRCCSMVGAVPIRLYNEERAQHYVRKHEKEERLSKKMDQYHVGDRIMHPVYGMGIINGITGEGVRRCIFVRFPEQGNKKLGLAWVSDNCDRV